MQINPGKRKRSAVLALPTVLLIFVLLLSNLNAFAQPDGKKLFKANCASCHYPSDQKLVGPGLKGVAQRWPDKNKLYAWIHNSQEYLKTGDPYATQLYEQYNKSVMTAFPDLKPEEIDAILAYAETGGKPAGGGDAPGGSVVEGAAQQPTDQTGKPGNGLYTLIVVGVIFIILIAVLAGVKRSLQNVVNERKGLAPVPDRTMGESIKHFFRTNRIFTGLAIAVLVIYGLSALWDSLLGVGVYTGYAPSQPIAFSHKIHAGENGINCVYCHSSVEKSRHAGIPSANVCMNCHKGIQEGSRTGKSEIGKIYAAIGYNTETQQYDRPQKPLKWIKVHNLPDHVYFNHSQHVKVGGIECKSCHGEVEKMDVVEQVMPLTMGWCIQCHADTKVKTEGSGYYDRFIQTIYDNPDDSARYHRAYQAHQGRTFTVEEIGGTECAKCHY